MFIEAKEGRLITTLSNYGTEDKPAFEVETYISEHADICMPDYICFTEQLRKLKYWISAEVKPKKSDKYVCWTDSDQVRTLEYSHRHRAFNASDYDEDAKHRISVKKWMYLEAFLYLTMEVNEYARILPNLRNSQTWRREEKEEIERLQGQA